MNARALEFLKSAEVDLKKLNENLGNSFDADLISKSEDLSALFAPADASSAISSSHKDPVMKFLTKSDQILDQLFDKLCQKNLATAKLDQTSDQELVGLLNSKLRSENCFLVIKVSSGNWPLFSKKKSLIMKTLRDILLSFPKDRARVLLSLFHSEVLKCYYRPVRLVGKLLKEFEVPFSNIEFLLSVLLAPTDKSAFWEINDVRVFIIAPDDDIDAEASAFARKIAQKFGLPNAQSFAQQPFVLQI